MAEFYGSIELVPYIGKDVSNFRSTLRTTKKYKDMQETLDYFEELKVQDGPNFFYKFKLDKDYKIHNLFWVDGSARKAYEAYGDCVSFDTTYMTNMYGMPFAPFIGINRHAQSFQLGCAFLRDEKTDSFVWLFKACLETMKGKAPLNIITNQDGAMRRAIELVFPNTNHRNYQWHIMDKASGTIGPYISFNQELKDEFTDCINYSVTPEEFEAKWDAMINKYGLGDIQHFQHLYSIRKSFVQTYYMHCFYPFLQSTQRSEGFNAVLKRYVNPNLSILLFVKQYEKIQQKYLVAQDGQDFRTDDNEWHTWSKYPIEKYASIVYTKGIFYKFSKEFEKTAEYDVQEHEVPYQYKLVPNDKFVEDYGTRSYIVTAIEEETSYYCECSKFDRDGIICCHIMKILIRFGVKTLPERYILKRWTQQAIPIDTDISADANISVDIAASGMSLQNKKTLRFSNLASALAKFAREGSNSDDAHSIVTKHIEMMQSELVDLKKRKSKSKKKKTTVVPSNDFAVANLSQPLSNAATTTSPPGHGTIATMSTPNPNVPAPTDFQDASYPDSSRLVRNLSRSVTKGRKKSERLSNGKNVQPKRKNKCSICHSENHNAAKCPGKITKRISSKEMQLFT
ncbi:protein FAR1-RELATED SEQUENCE 5-like [Phragmites australis]|uniref:protein FAR1-RELATED SEQUENCE 5-like n=1 Tax=Phragmites australis TaxID=29695 RepID=UPI002D764E2E|nr:protein FAR1-RELATED SEQUENCE 5-like [Phragmites australis]